MSATTAVDMTKHDTQMQPKRVVAGGLVWTAANDAHPLGSPIGWDLAVRHGQAAPADRSSR